MLPYIFTLLLSIICLFFPQKRWAKLLSLGSLFAMSAFRGENVGADTINYLNYASEQIREISFATIGNNLEFLTNIILYIIRYNNLSSRILIVIFSIVTIGTIPIISKRIGISPVYVCYFFLVGQFVLSLNITRQITAGMLITLGATYIFEEKKEKSLFFFLFLVLAVGIHATSLIYMFLYLCRYIKLEYIHLVIMSCILLLLSFTGIFNVSIFKEYSEYFGDYALTYSDIFIRDISSISFFGWIIPTLILFVKLYLLSDKDNPSWYSLLMISLCIPMLFRGADSVLARLIIPFGMISDLILADAMAKSERNSIKRTISYLMIIPLSYIYIRSLNPQVLPYYFCF